MSEKESQGLPAKVKQPVVYLGHNPNKIKPTSSRGEFC